MLQLIAVVISIALVAVLAVASLYYGGAAFTAASTRAKAAQAMNGGQQISAAAQIMRLNSTGGTPSIDAMISASYLNGRPPPVVDPSAGPLEADVAGIRLPVDDNAGNWQIGGAVIETGGDVVRAFPGEVATLTIDRGTCLAIARSVDEPPRSVGADPAGGCFRISFPVGAGIADAEFADGSPAYTYAVPLR